MSVSLITDSQELTALASDWNRLADSMPLRSHEWLATWWKHYQRASRSRELFLLVARNTSGTVTGIAPCYREHTLARGRVVRMMGDGEVCTDHLSLIVAPSHAATFAADLAEWLAVHTDAWDYLSLDGLDADDATAQTFSQQLADRGCRVTPKLSGRTWSIDLPSDWEAFLALQSKSHRKQLRQADARVLQSPRARWHQVTSLDELRLAWPVLVDLHQRRRNSLGEPGCFASPAFAHFHREVAELLLVRGQLRVSWLELDATPIAAEYHFADASTTYAYQGGVDPTRLTDEPGRLSMIAAIQAAIGEGHSRFDLLRGDEPYKAHWRAQPRPQWQLRATSRASSSRWRNSATNTVVQVASWLRAGSAPLSTPQPTG